MIYVKYIKEDARSMAVGCLSCKAQDPVSSVQIGDLVIFNLCNDCLEDLHSEAARLDDRINSGMFDEDEI